MKQTTHILYTFLASALLLLGCTKDFDEINTDPNNPLEVSTSALMTSAQKSLLDDIRDEWFSGRQSYLYAQYFAQRNYTEEDRYQIRQTTNNTYWRLIYTDLKDLQEIIKLNTNQATRSKAATYGNNENQIAAARILKAWAFQILTDTYGDIPYVEALQGETLLTPSYTAQQEIYADLIKELTEASAQLILDEPVLHTGDIIYGGDAAQWKKFANSLKMRVALRMSKVNPAYRTYITEALAAGVFESNEDNAVFTYLGTSPNNAPLYDAYFTAGRNDITLAKPFVDLLKGENDVLNNKNNPFKGLLDPRLELWAMPAAGEYTGIPYGILNNETQTARAGKINLYARPTIVNAANATLTYMDYAEVCFILSEVNGFDQAWYKKGIEASLAYWGDQAARVNRWSKDQESAFAKKAEEYLAALPPATQETVLTQKYIASFLDGYQAWAEYRRTGYPKTLLRPGEISYRRADGSDAIFRPLVGNDIPRRVTYPVNEQTLNSQNYNAAKTSMGGDDLSTRVWWDK